MRKLSVLAKLSRHRKISAPEIQQQLMDEGEEVSLRTVQRDLVELASKFPVCSDESKPIGWHLKKDAELTLPDYDLTTAITFTMADKYLSNLLPPVMRERLEPYIRTANQFLVTENRKPQSQWPQKIIVHTKGQPLHTSDISAETIEAIYASLFSAMCLRLTYKSLTTSEENDFTFHPYGIVVRSERSYLVGKYDGYDDIRSLLLSRVIKAEQTKREADIDSDFSLSNYVGNGNMGVIRSGHKLAIKLWITPILAEILTETPLSKDQVFSPKEDDFILTASVDDTDELRHWILSMCNHATVLSPETLRKEIKDILVATISYYED
ncbi:helix-turn-helix transcriptional regulator [Photobacterium sanguinicancri]|uniref:helix-turn-helix transcriptional regulator n=1 Tax=Photobacterium sanguinicancri TaxID=875932 RepID=UPI0026E29A4F|nr:WYL domain-containing protein [Photobacterium sanguinicancri]MDO6499007.1 WYL domain-containing protein [Photobacterium sanguinicancri]